MIEFETYYYLEETGFELELLLINFRLSSLNCLNFQAYFLTSLLI